jgi:hypothetical protein
LISQARASAAAFNAPVQEPPAGCALFAQLVCSAYAGTNSMTISITGSLDEYATAGIALFVSPVPLASIGQIGVVIAPGAGFNGSYLAGLSANLALTSVVLPRLIRMTVNCSTADSCTWGLQYGWVPLF